MSFQAMEPEGELLEEARCAEGYSYKMGQQAFRSNRLLRYLMMVGQHQQSFPTHLQRRLN